MLEARIKDLELQAALNQKFHELELRLDARQQARDEAKRGSEMIPQSELLAKIEKLQCQVGDLESVADLDAPFFASLPSGLVNLRRPTASKRASLSLLMRPNVDQRFRRANC